MKNHSEVQLLSHPLFKQKNVTVWIKRDDIIHPIISGNKWRKLKYNLTYIQQHQSIKGALTFGGGFSNHIHAFAYACFQHKIPCVGIIRGEESYANNFTLTWARRWGMNLHFVNRKTYRRRFDSDYIEELQALYPNYFIIPEGGSNNLAIPGVAEIITELKEQIDFDTLITPVGSGGTLAGLITGDKQSHPEPHRLLGVAVLKNADYLVNEVKSLLPPMALSHDKWQLLTNFHGGGYAKFSSSDVSRLLDFSAEINVDFEPVYSGKMILAFLDLLEQNYFATNERIVLLHTGGIQGIGGLLERKILDKEVWSNILNKHLYQANI